MKFEVLRTINMSKKGSNNISLDNFTFSLYRGEILGLIGENSGDSALLLDIISGETLPDSGVMHINEKPVTIGTIANARKAGIHRLWKESSLIQEFSVAENLFISDPSSSPFEIFYKKKSVLKAVEILDEYGITMNPKTKVDTLSPAMQHIIMLITASLHSPKIIIFDNVLSTYSEGELSALLSVIRRLQEKGVSFILNESNLEKTLHMAERVVLIKNGRNIGAFYSENISKSKIQKIFTGHSTVLDIVRPYSSSPLPFFQVSNLRFDNCIIQDLYVRPGEIVGIVDFTNERASSIMKILGGHKSADSGSVYLNNFPVDISSPETVIKNKIGYIDDSINITQNLSILENLSLPALRRHTNFWGKINFRMLKLAYDELADKISLEETDLSKKGSSLNEHDQLKIYLYRYLASNFRILLFDNPFARKSIAMTQTIYKVLQDASSQKIGVIIYSPNMSDIVDSCNRYYVIRDFSVTEASPEAIKQLNEYSPVVSEESRYSEHLYHDFRYGDI